MLRLASAPLAAALAAALFAFPASAQPANFDAYVGRVLATFDVPGASVTIVKDGQTVLAKGYGTRVLGESAPVDAHTRFGIASNSKAFTATALGMLVEEGKLEWDAPVVRYLPGFALSDPYVTRELTVRDLLVHRSGLSLGAGDLLWWPAASLSREETVSRLRHLPLATSFRSAYAYDNVLYLVAGEVVEAVSGQSWEDFVQRRILDRLGMADSRARIREGLAGSNVAATFAPVDGVVVPVVAFDGENAGPAAGIMSSARDMGRWLTVQLDSGRVDVPGVAPGRLFSRATTAELWAPVTPMPFSSPYPAEIAALEPQFSFYALGFGVKDYRGVKTVSHTGGLPGYLSQVTMVPSLGLGIVVLTNGESGQAFSSITQHVIDHYLGAPPTDWVGGFEALRARSQARVAAASAAAEAARDRSAGPSLPLAAYAGTYTDAWYGDVTVAPTGDGLSIRFAHTPLLVGLLEHWQHDTFVVRWTDRTLRADAFLTFSLNPDGSIYQARMAPASPDVDFSFDFQDLLLKPSGQ